MPEDLTIVDDTAPDGGSPADPTQRTYPDTVVGMLQEQYGQLQEEIAAVRAMADQYTARANAAEARAAQVQSMIDALSATPASDSDPAA